MSKLYITLPIRTDLDQNKYLNLLNLMKEMAKKEESKELINRLSNAIANATNSKTKKSISMAKPISHKDLPVTKMPESMHNLLKGITNQECIALVTLWPEQLILVGSEIGGLKNGTMATKTTAGDANRIQDNAN